MRLIGLHAEGFGRLHQFSCDLDAPITVVYGPNEAGKSTALAFVRSMLYGFAKRANAAERQEPVFGGRHGGRLVFRGRDGCRYILERYASVPGKVSVRRIGDPDAPGDEGGTAEIMTQAAWERQFLDGIGERMFRQLFAITLAELQAVGMLEGDELGKQLYHAGWGGGAAIAKAEKTLGTQLGELYKPRGSTQRIGRLLKELERTEDELRRLGDGIAAFNELTVAAERAAVRLQEETDKLPQLRERAELLARACGMHGVWLDNLALQKEKEVLGPARRLPSEARARFEALAVERERLLAGLDRADRELSAAERELAALEDERRPELLAHADRAEALLLSAESAQAYRLERREIEAELREHGTALSRLLARVARDWNEERLRELRVTVADRDSVRSFRLAMAEAEEDRKRAEMELTALTEQIREASDQLGRLEAPASAGRDDEGVPQLLPETPEALRQAALAFEDAWRELELERLRDGHESRGAQTPAGGLAALLAAAGALAAAAAGFAAAGWRAAAAAAGAGAAVLAAAALLRRRPRREAAAAAAARLAAAERRAAAALRALVREPAAALAALLGGAQPAGAAGAPRREPPGGPAAAQAYRREAAAAAETAAPAGASPARLRRAAARSRAAETAAAQRRAGIEPPDAAAFLARLRAAVAARQDELRGGAFADSSRQELTRRLERLNARQLALSESAGRAAGRRAELEAEWAGWLAAKRLPAPLSPDAALETFDLAEQALLRLETRDRAADKAAAIDSRLAQFDEEARKLADVFPDLLRAVRGDVSAALRLLKTEADKQREAKRRMAELQERIGVLAAGKEEQQAVLDRIDEQRGEWLAAAGAAGETEWLEAVERSERLAAIDAETARLEAQLQAGLSPVQRQRIETWYAEADERGLAERKREAEAELAQAEERIGGLREELGRTRQKLDQLLRENDRRRLAAERELQLAELERLTGRYAVWSLASALIGRTKRIMERQRQPAVLREASRFMRIMSGGRYVRVSVPESSPDIRLEAADGREIGSAFLSRGTAEQLYLSMRFALADEAAAELPMILDDLFVNFDRGRLEAAISVLGELSGRRQLVLLTCHEHIRDLLLDKLPEAKRVDFG
ncbi:AAA family ATPase [Paenibacillus humicola]|uniref:AAA family ATPase n=1 Tax=Paenibacillus humicola TaxID=3110540 RepID=UPI00237B8DA2|nr:AAA family ATPase [Paenibacillus humicola]